MINLAKKKGGSKKSKKQVSLPENSLPVNIQLVGKQSADSDKKIYISQPVYKEIHRFAQNKTTVETGGVLRGVMIEEFGKKNIVISAFIEAKYSEGTPTTLTFTHKSWDEIAKEEEKYKGTLRLGWIHTHPDFGIFLSDYDKFNQKEFFKEECQVAYVIDPIRHEEGFYCWENGNIVKCDGFYLYDDIGVKLDVVEEKDGTVSAKRVSDGPLSFKNVLLVMLTFVVFVLSFLVFSLSGEIKELKSNLQSVVNSANQSIMVIQSELNSVYAQLDKINDELFPEEETTAVAEENNQ